RAGFHQAELVAERAADLEHQLAAEGARRIGDLYTDRGIGVVGGAGRHARARLQAQRVPLRNDFLGRLGGDGDASLPRRGFGGYANLHEASPLVVGPGLTASLHYFALSSTRAGPVP